MEWTGPGLLLATLVLGMSCWSCAGLPVYDYDPISFRDALEASVSKVNSQSLSPYLLRAFRGSLKKVDLVDEETLNMDLEFSVRETTCRKDSEANPTTCDFQRGYHVPAAECRSTVQVSTGEVDDVWVRCYRSFSSESDSSEEKILALALRPHGQRNNYQTDVIPDGLRRYQHYDRSRDVIPDGLRRYQHYDRSRDVIPDGFRRYQHYDRSRESTRSVPVPGNRNFRSQWYRGRIDMGQE